MRRLFLTLLTVALLGACSSESGDLVARNIVSEIPWTVPERARYRLLQGDDVKGSGELRLEESGGALVVSQSIEFPDIEVLDSVAVEADPQTLRPRLVERTIDGPEGKRECQALYQARNVKIDQKTEQDERSDRLSVPAEHYDSWSDLFLWRTVEFFEGHELRYVDVSSCSLAKPELISPVLRVKQIESVSVPAGTFDAWRLEFRAEGRTQKAWYADDERRTLVRYDNGDLVFELESIN